jgi:hypothetical protein
LPHVSVTAREDRLLRLELRAPPATREQAHGWARVLTRVVDRAYAGRAALAITLSPAPWSFGRTVPGSELARIADADHLLSPVARCSSEFLNELVESEDFQRGLLWLTSLAWGDVRSAERTIRALDITAVEPTCNEETLLCTDDGRALHWIQPGRPLAPVLDELRAFTAARGWNLSVAR